LQKVTKDEIVTIVSGAHAPPAQRSQNIVVAEPALPPLAPAALAELARTYEKASPQAIIAWAVATYGAGMTLACSFGGPSGMALLDMTLRIQPDVPVFYLDTDFLFPETHALVDVVAQKYNITPFAVRPSLSPKQQADRYGEALWTRDPDACCDLRKVAPQRDYLRQFTAWMTGIRRDQAATRRATPVIQWDAQFGLAKISPLAGWDERQVWAYIVANDIPYNALHDHGYPSIGCTNCTRAVVAGEDPRAGRWSGFAKTECGIHLPGTVATATPVAEPPVAEPPTEVPPPAPTTPGNDLLSLGVGKGSKVEQIKAASQYMRGQIVEQMHSDATHFTDDQTQLLKMHGTYQQDDRDIRRARTGEKAYQFMVRSRIPGGMLTAEQYLAEDRIAETYANGTLRITTRQGLQLHGILKGDLQAAIHEINETLLTTLAACGDVNRNVMACPAPVATRAQAQVLTIAQELARRLAPQSPAYHEIWIDGEQHSTVTTPGAEVVEPLYGPSYLPRKFKIGVAYPGDNCVDVYTQDIGLVAEVQDDALVGFTVLIGGGMGMTHGKTTTYPRVADPLCFVAPDQLFQVVEAIITIQRDYGDRQNRKHARMKYLVAERGVAWFREETERRLGFALMAPHPVRWHGVEDHLGWHKQADGRWFLGLLVENGRIRDTESVRLRSGLRHAIERFKPGIHLTGQQNIMLTDIPTRQKAPLVALLASYGIITKPDEIDIARFAMACPALPTCGLALAEAERVAPEIVAQVADFLREIGMDGERLSIRMTGCPNGCARPYMGDIGIVGRSKDLYALFLGGDWANTRLNELYADAVPMQDLLPTLQPLLRLWRDERKARETFGDFCHRIGLATLRSKASQISLSIGGQPSPSTGGQPSPSTGGQTFLSGTGDGQEYPPLHGGQESPSHEA
jgi:sulfite reductase (ferredoxin)